MEDTAPDQSIAEAHFRCIDAFEALIGATHAQPAQQCPPGQGLSLQDVFDKYKLWSGNLGAMHSGRNWKRSLDCRLREATFYKEQVLRLLKALQSSIEKALSMHPDADKRIKIDVKGDVKGDVEAGDTGDNDSPWEVSSDSETGHTDPHHVRRPVATSMSVHSTVTDNDDPLAGYTSSLELIEHIVICLWGLPIRRPAPLDRIKETASASTPYQPFDIMHVTEKFPTIEKGLAARLGRMISRRRQLLLYRNRHVTALHGKHLTARRPVNDARSDPDEDNYEGTPSITASTQHTRDTKATTLMLDQQNHILPEFGESFAPSVASSSSSIFSQDSNGETPIKVPKRPKGVDRKVLEQFVCPYCQTAQTISSDRKWRKHVLSDLQPYLCTYPECSLRDHVFDNIAEWYQHETLSHRLEWTCNTDGHSAFTTTKDFLLHMKSSHNQGIREGQLQVLTHTFQQPTRSHSGVCTLCGKVSGRLKSHTSRHLQQLALFAIPQTDYLDESDTEDVDSDIARLSHTALSKAAGSREAPSLANNTAGTDVVQEDASVETEEAHISIPHAPEAETWDYIAPKFQEARAALNDGLSVVDTREALQRTAENLNLSANPYMHRTKEKLHYLRAADHDTRLHVQEVELTVQESGKYEHQDATPAKHTSHQDLQSTSSQVNLVAPSSSRDALGDGYYGEMAVMNPYHQQRPLCGASIGAFNGEHLLPVSLGGIIMVDGEPYGLTVHHILDTPRDDESDDEEDDIGEVEIGESIQASGSVRPGSSDTPKVVAPVDTHKPIEGLGGNPWLMGMESQNTPVSDSGNIAPMWDLELSDDETDNHGPPNDEVLGFEFSDDELFDSDASGDVVEDEEHAKPTTGDIEGIAPGGAEEIMITQPAIDDVDTDFFLYEEDRDDDHLSCHKLGHIYASSGIRRWRRQGILHEIDWALIKIHEDRLQPYNVVQGGGRFRFNTGPHIKQPPLVEPVDRRHYKPEEDEYPTEVASADSLGDMNVHCFGRTTGLQGGIISRSMTSVRLCRRKTYSRSWHVAGGFGVGGDAGAWVIQNGTGFVCGIVLAWCHRNHVACIEPMEVILEDIKRTLGAKYVYLPGSKEEKEFQAGATSLTK